jgi:hypothetical protein
MGFITSEQHGELQSKLPEKVVAVFVPTTPNPTGGFLLLLPEDQVIKLEMSVADGIKYVISLGSIVPEAQIESFRREALNRWMGIRGSVIETAAGVILRTRPLTETSLIVHWLTRDEGRLATVAKGARRAKSVFRGKLDLFYTAEFSFSRSRRSELHTLREVELQGTHPELRQDLARLRQACYGANLIEQATEMETPLPRVFDFFSDFLNHLLAVGAEPQNVFAFEFKLLRELGLQPELEKTRLNPGTKLLANALTESDWQMIARLRPSEAQIKELNQFLHGFLIFHLGKIPKGRGSAG